MLSELQSLTLQKRVLHIYPNHQVDVPKDASTPPILKDGAKPIVLEIHSLTSAQLNEVREIQNSITPPYRLNGDGSIMLDENNDPISNYRDPEYQTLKQQHTIFSQCLAIYYGCDSIRDELIKENKSSKELPEILTEGMIETISMHILNAENIAYRHDFFSQASSAITQSSKNGGEIQETKTKTHKKSSSK